MQVKKRLEINVALSVIAAFLIVLIGFLALTRVNLAVKKSEIANEIVSSAFERNTFRNDYVRTSNEMAKVQWFAKSEQYGKLLKSASDIFKGADIKNTIDELIENHESTVKLFSEIVQNHEKARTGAVPAELSEETENRLLTQLNMRGYSRASLTRQLRESAREYLFVTLRMAVWSIFFVIAVMTAAATINSWTIGRTIINRIRLLRDGSSVIGEGNLDHRIEIKGDDEFADLSNAFNTMTGKLRASYVSLENEIAERKRNEEEARLSGERYARLFNIIREGFAHYKAVYDQSGKLVDLLVAEINPAGAKLSGVTREAQIGKTWRQVWPGVDEKVFAVYQQVDDTGDPARFDNDNRLTGRIYSVAVSKAAPGEFVVSFSDITDRKRAEEGLRESERRYSALFANKINGMSHCRVITDEHGRPVDYRILQINEAYERIIGIKKADIEGRRVKEVFPGIENYAFDYIGVYGKIALGGGEIKFEEFFEATRQYLSIYAYSPLPGEFAAIFTDVTERKRTEEALRESEERYRALISASSQGLYRMSPDWTEMRELRGGSLIADTAKPNRNWLQEYIHPDDRKGVTEAIAESLRTGNVFELEHRVRRVDGTIGWTFSRAVPMRNVAGDIVEWFGAASDITGRKRAEEDIEKLNEELSRNVHELESSNKELEAFIYSVAHDLRAPLRSISGFSEILLKRYADKVDEKGKKQFNFIIHNAEQMNKIIEDLLYLSRISRYEMRREDLDISRILMSLAAELHANQPERRVAVEIKEGMPGFADARLMQVALSNLLGKAWKFTTRTAQAKIECGSMDRDGKTIYYVKDNGAGFEQRFTDRMFLPFHRLHNEQEFEGRGIGLAIVERAIRRHGGKIWAEGKKNEGATFFFTLS